MYIYTVIYVWALKTKKKYLFLLDFLFYIHLFSRKKNKQTNPETQVGEPCLVQITSLIKGAYPFVAVAYLYFTLRVTQQKATNTMRSTSTCTVSIGFAVQQQYAVVLDTIDENRLVTVGLVYVTLIQ